MIVFSFALYHRKCPVAGSVAGSVPVLLCVCCIKTKIADLLAFTWVAGGCPTGGRG
jgi:hypothetical protein